MAIYTSATATYPIGGHGLGGTMKVYFAEVSCTAAPATTDTLQFFTVPANFRPVHVVLEASDMDTDGSPTLTLNIGDSGDADRVFAASTVAQAGTAATATKVDGLFHLYTSATLITGTAQANATAGAAGTVRLMMAGILEDSATS